MVELYWPTLNLVNEINEYMSSSNPTEGITYLSFNVGLFFIFEKKNIFLYHCMWFYLELATLRGLK